MVTSTGTDFKVSTRTQKEDLRQKLDQLGQELVAFAQKACPTVNTWDNYVTGKSEYVAQWGAVCPNKVSEFKDLLTTCPNIFFHIPQNGQPVWVATNVEFKRPRERLIDHCTGSSASRFVSVLQKAKGATITILKKEVLVEDRRNYRWEELWDPQTLPEIDVSQCTVQYLEEFVTRTKVIPQHKKPGWTWEPIFLVRYEFKPHEIVQSADVVKLFGEKVELLAPIIEHLIL